MAYTTIDKPSDYFETVTYTGNTSSGTTINSLDFAPNMVWFKSRTNAENHQIYDSVRGVTKRIIPNGTQAEATASTGLTNFDSNGFRTGGENETDSGNIVAWNWKAGTSFTNDASATGVGTIDSTGSINTTAGFSIISYTGTGSAGTVAHGLGSELACYIIKQRNTTGGWIVYHKGNTSSPQTDYLRLDKTDATVDDAIFNDTAPTSSVFSIGTNAPVNTSSGTYIAYCFAEKQGYSKFGSYTANNSSNGTYIHLGFKPALFICKKSSGTESWYINDNKRSAFNPTKAELYADNSQAEGTGNARLDLLSNGVKMRTDNGGYNYSTNTYIYMAFAESPFVSSTGVPATAR